MHLFFALVIVIFSQNNSIASVNKIVRGPYLQKASSNSITIRWRTKRPSIGIVKLYTNDSEQYYKDLVMKTEHEINISGLDASEKYNYSIHSLNKNKKERIANLSKEEIFSFKTFPDNKLSESNILILGDPGVSSDSSIPRKFRNQQGQVINGFNHFIQCNNIDLDFVLTLGDNAYHNGTDKEFQKGFFEPYADLIANTPLFTCFGNHDSGLERKFLSYTARSYPKPSGVYYDIFSLPGERAYYSFDHGSAHFIVLDSFDSLWEDLAPDYSNFEKVWDKNSSARNSMLEWFKEDLKNNLSTWNIVVFHHPPFTSDSEYAKQDLWRAWTNSHIVPLVHEYKIDLVLSGHIHNYQRTYPVGISEFALETNLAPRKNIKKSKEKFFKKYLEKKKNLELMNYVPLISSSETNIYNKGDGVIYSIIGSSGAAFKSLENDGELFYVSRLEEAGAGLLKINPDKLTYDFVGREGQSLDKFVISR
jgi:acid phosphatase type 7